MINNPQMIKSEIPIRKEKHVLLYDTIQELDGVLESLHILSARINGITPNNSPKDVPPKPPAPCLADILIGSPETIREKVDAMLMLIQGISDSIF